MIDTIINELNFTRLYQSYSEEGQPAYHPKMLMKVLIYGYCIGVISSRELSEKLHSDIYFIFLWGMQYPEFRTISDFRFLKRSYLSEYFIQVLEICKQTGLYNMSHVSIDGSKIKANASKKRTHNENEEELARYEKQVKTILNEAEAVDKDEDEKLKRINITDHDASFMRIPSGSRNDNSD